MHVLRNQKCMIQPTFINLHPNKYNQELCYYSFVFIDVLEFFIKECKVFIKGKYFFSDSNESSEFSTSQFSSSEEISVINL